MPGSLTKEGEGSRSQGLHTEAGTYQERERKCGCARGRRAERRGDRRQRDDKEQAETGRDGERQGETGRDREKWNRWERRGGGEIQDGKRREERRETRRDGTR